MCLRLVLALLLCAACASPQPAQRTAEPADLAFTHVNVVDVETGDVLPEQTVLIAGNRIQSVGPSARVRVPSGTKVVEARSKYLIPGLIDTHVHLGWDLDSAAMRELLPHFPAAGVTTVREASSRSTEPQQIAARAAIEAGHLLGPRLVVAGRVDARAVRRAGVSGPTELARRLAALGVNGLKVRSGLTREQVLAIIGEGRRLGLPVFGHTVDDTLSYAAAAIRAGLAGVMHVEPLARDLPLAPGARPDPPPTDPKSWGAQWWHHLVRWTLVDSAAANALARLIVTHGVWLEPTLAISAGSVFPERWRNDPRVARLPEILVRDIADTTRLPSARGDSLVRARDAYWRMTRFVRQVHVLGGVVVTGTDNAPLPAWGIHDELTLLVEAGLPPGAALQAATVNAARVLGWDERLGTIREGKLADLVLLDANPLEDIRNTQKIVAVVLNGRYLDRKALDELLAK